jgi:F420-0:gamma-glutamyl ligase
MKPLAIHALKTRIFHNGDNLLEFLLASVPQERVHNKMLLAITSKIVSLSENRLVKVGEIDKDTLVRKEADIYLDKVAYGYALTVKNGHLIPSAGIDESNSETGDYILYPQDCFVSAKTLWLGLREQWQIEDLGVLITDSHTKPLRRGVTGFCLAYWGFRAIRSLIGSKDLFGRELQVTQMNLADGLSAAAVLCMGEGNERCPVAIFDNARVDFVDEVDPTETSIALKDDLFYPLLEPLLPRSV